jgi:hypothetical protein
MKKYLWAALAGVIMAAACGEPSSPSGTLPVVQNVRIIEELCKGDTIVIGWDALDVPVDGYHIYYSPLMVPWSDTEFLSEDTTYTHIAGSTGYYYVKASDGLNYSSGNSNMTDTRTSVVLGDYELRFGAGESNGIVFGENGAVIGDAASGTFAQDIYIGEANSLIYLYSGDCDPDSFPGGSSTRLVLKGYHGNEAPEPGSSEWVDSLQVTGVNWVFLELENGHYIEMIVDSVYTNGADISSYEYQSIEAVRLFNML